MKYTPAPWEIIHRDDDYSMCMTVICQKGLMGSPDNDMWLSDDPNRDKVIAMTLHQMNPTVGEDYDIDIIEGNTNLMSKAPEMYELLKWFLEPDHPIGSDAGMVYEYTKKVKSLIKEIENE